MNFDKPFELRTEKGLKQVQKKFDAIPVHLKLYIHKIVFQTCFFLNCPGGARRATVPTKNTATRRAALILLKHV